MIELHEIYKSRSKQSLLNTLSTMTQSDLFSSMEISMTSPAHSPRLHHEACTGSTAGSTAPFWRVDLATLCQSDCYASHSCYASQRTSVWARLPGKLWGGLNWECNPVKEALCYMVNTPLIILNAGHKEYNHSTEARRGKQNRTRKRILSREESLSKNGGFPLREETEYGSRCCRCS